MSERGKELSSTHSGELRIEWQNDRIIFTGDDGENMLLIGPRVDGILAVELAQDGTDVLTATDDELVMSSRFKGFKILDIDTVTVGPFNAAANSTTIESAEADYESGVSGFSPIVLGFTNSLPSGGLFLWQGVSPESTLSSPASSPMGYTVYVRFDTLTTPDSPGLGNTHINFNVTVRNATASPINGITYTIKYYVLTETVPA